MRTVLRLVRCFKSVNLIGLFAVASFLLYFTRSEIKPNRCKHETRSSRNILFRYQVSSQSSDASVSYEPLNWIPIRFLAEPNVCKSSSFLRYLFVVHSSASDAGERNFLRTHIFTKKNRDEHNFQSVFVVGNPKGGNLTKLFNEAEVHQDMLVVNITENYHNITHKTRGWVSWVRDKCSHLNYTHVIKIDDDVMVNFDALIELLEDFKDQRRAILCRVFQDGAVVRNNESKWYLSDDEYELNSLGLFCQGMSYILTSDLVENMYRNLKKMDDWYVTHALVYNSRAIYVDISPHMFPIESLPQLNHVLTTFKNRPNYRPIFGHFRPKISFQLEHRAQNWTKMIGKHDCAKADRLF